MPNRRAKTAGMELTAEEAFSRTHDRETAIAAAGYTLRIVWEHEVLEQLKRDKEMRDFFDKCKFLAPMGPREAFFGGRLVFLFNFFSFFLC